MIIIQGTFVWPEAYLSAVRAVSAADANVLRNGHQKFTVMLDTGFDRLPQDVSFDALAICAVYAYEDRIHESLSPEARRAGDAACEAENITLADCGFVSALQEVDETSVTVVQSLLAADVAAFISGGAYVMVVHEYELHNLLRVVAAAEDSDDQPAPEQADAAHVDIDDDVKTVNQHHAESAPDSQ